MSMSLQKANFWKRISAFMFDAILIVSLALALAFAMTAILQYDKKIDTLNAYRTQYETEYGIDFEITKEEYDDFTEEQKTEYDLAYEKADKAMRKDKAVMNVYYDLISLTLTSITVSLLVSDFIVYFVVPLLFKNGQTLGKKIFGLAVMRTNSVKISNPALFIRAMVGRFAIETMFPVSLIVMFCLGLLPIGPIVVILLGILEIVVMVATKTNSSVHDLISDTVVVDMASQQIFDTIEEMENYQAQLAAEKAAKAQTA